MRKLFFLICFLFFTACQPSSLEDFQWEGSSVARILLNDLRKIETREDLSWAEPILRRDFEKLVDLMIQARVFHQKNPDLEISFQNMNPVLNQSLVEELKRIYGLEGGRECIERSQKEAMLKLHAKEKLIQKQQSSLRPK